MLAYVLCIGRYRTVGATVRTVGRLKTKLEKED